MIRTAKKTILKIFMMWHLIVFAYRSKYKNVQFTMADRPWWVVKSLSCVTVPNVDDVEFQNFLTTLKNEAKKEIIFRDNQKI